MKTTKYRHTRKTKKQKRKSKKILKNKTQRGGGPSDTYLLLVINCVRRYNRLNYYFENYSIKDMENWIYERDKKSEFKIWDEFKQLFNERSDMLELFSMMRHELSKYRFIDKSNFGNLFDGYLEYNLEDTGYVARSINDQIQNKPDKIGAELKILHMFGDPNAKPLNNLFFNDMKKYCDILTAAENLCIDTQVEFPDIPALLSKS